MSIPLLNPYAIAVKKHVLQLLDGKYFQEDDEILDRIVQSLAIESDVKNFLNLMNKIYQTGYGKAVETAREAVEKSGFKLRVSQPK